jgi:hypothetical protein
MYMHDDAWHCLRTGESGENIIDFTDSDIFYVSGYGGGFRRTVDGGTTLVSINPPGVSNWVWLWPYVMHPTDPKTIYIATADIFKSTDMGETWTTITSNLAGGQLDFLEIAPSSPNTMITGYSGSLWKTTLGGLSWERIDDGLPNIAISDVCFSPLNPDHIWVTAGQFNPGQKVYRTLDGGQTWENISANLPNLPVNTIVCDNDPDEGIYIGMDVGVFYINNTISDWIDFSDGLPNVVVTELEIQENALKLRAGTYGRGLWESDLYNPAVNAGDQPIIRSYRVHPNPADNVLFLSLNLQKECEQVNIYLYDITGKMVLSEHKIRINGYDETRLDLSGFPAGVYFLKVFADAEIINEKIICY